jgi:hypothetical protein
MAKKKKNDNQFQMEFYKENKEFNKILNTKRMTIKTLKDLFPEPEFTELINLLRKGIKQNVADWIFKRNSILEKNQVDYLNLVDKLTNIFNLK